MEKGWSFQHKVLGHLDWMHTQKVSLNITLCNSKWITDLDVKCKTIKLLEENIAENLCDLGFGDKILEKILKCNT